VVYKSNGRGSVLTEALHSVMPAWIPGSNVTELKGVSELIDGGALYNLDIRQRAGTGWGT
jgi:hypothetical protein